MAGACGERSRWLVLSPEVARLLRATDLDQLVAMVVEAHGGVVDFDRVFYRVKQFSIDILRTYRTG
jgi:hypothetical protein